MILTLIISLLFCQFHPGQADQTEQKEPHPIAGQQATDLPRPTPVPPKITLQKALAIADRYIQKEKIDVSSFYLREAKLIFPTEKVEDRQWHFWWVGVKGESGNNISIVVSMVGEASRRPTM
jgi:hypothetical protein